MLNIKSGEGAHQTCTTMKDGSTLKTYAVDKSTQHAHIDLCQLRIMVHNKVGEAVYHTCVTTKDRGDNAGEGSYHATPWC